MSGSTSLVCMATSLRFTESAVTVMPPASGQPTTRHFQSIAAFHHYLQWPPPEHPLLGLVSLAQMESQHISTSQPLRNDFYMVTLKNVLAGNMTYGRTRFDFSNGTMLFHAPGQVVQFASGDFYQAGIPSVERMASLLSVSPRYLSDALKAETGKTAIEHIHGFLIEEAKNLLLERNKTVAEVAYQLGFEYPQYFSRLFKAKVGVSPTAFQKR